MGSLVKQATANRVLEKVGPLYFFDHLHTHKIRPCWQGNNAPKTHFLNNNKAINLRTIKMEMWIKTLFITQLITQKSNKNQKWNIYYSICDWTPFKHYVTVLIQVFNVFLTKLKGDGILSSSEEHVLKKEGIHGHTISMPQQIWN